MDSVCAYFSRPGGKIRPLHGVNNGPCTFAFSYDHTADFRRARIPFCRLHNTEFPFGSSHFVDLPCVFPNYEADPDDENNYDFAMTDQYLRTISDAGAKVIYRLGVSAEHLFKKYFVYPPNDCAHWARICAGIVRHYNEGWANGFSMGIERWEIWNEPENPSMWQGARAQYFEMYRAAACHLKAAFPNIRVGGCGSGGFSALLRPAEGYLAESPAFAEAFLSYIADPAHPAPLDFFSWHGYCEGDIDDLVFYARHARSLMNRYGFARAESIMDEWNYTRMPNQFERMASPEGAAAVAAILARLQRETDVDIACYYDAQPAMVYCGLFSMTGLRKPYYAFEAFGALYALGREAEVASEGAICALAAVGDGAALMLVNPSGTARDARVTLDGLPEGARARLRMTDETRDFADMGEVERTFTLAMPPYATALIMAI